MVIPFLEAKNYTRANRTSVDLIVLHSAENQEKPGTARRVAQWVAGKNAPEVSFHYVLDDLETIQCVRDEHVAWAAPGANRNGIHIEHSGRANQTSSDWEDDFSERMLLRSVDLCVDLCRKWNIPAVEIGVEDLRAGEKGITTHAAVSKAFKKSTHTDPGVAFPLSWFVGRISSRLGVKA